MKSKNYTLIPLLIFYFILVTMNANAIETNFTPRISLSEEYTDNVFLTKNNTEDDTILSVSPGITAQLLGKTSGMEISYDPSYVTYHSNSRSDTWRHSCNLQSWAEVTKNTQFTLSNTFFLTEDPLPDQDVAVSSDQETTNTQNTTVRRDRRRYYTNSTTAQLEYTFGYENLLGLSYTYRFLKNDDDEFNEDNEAHIPAASWRYGIAPRWSLGVQGSYTRGLYNQPNDFTDEPSDDYEEWNGEISGIHSFDWQWNGYIMYGHIYRTWDGANDFNDDYVVYNPSIGLDYILNQETAFSINVGYFYREIIDDRGENDDNSSGLSGFARMDHNFAERANLFLSLSYGYSSSDFSSEALGFNKYYSASGSVSYNFNPYITGNVFGSYRETKFLDTQPRRTDKFTRIGTGLTATPLTWLAVEMQYSLRKYSSDESAGYTENRISLGIQIQTDWSYRW